MNEAWRLPAWRRGAAGAIGDHILALLIVLVAILAWSPLTGVSAAREAVAARRGRRSRLAEIDRTQSPVWARQERRNTLGWQRHAEAVRWRADP